MDGACIPAFNSGIEKRAISPNVPDEIRARIIPFVLFITDENKSVQMYINLPDLILKICFAARKYNS